MNADIRKKSKNDFEKDFESWWMIYFLEKTMENVRKYTDIKLVITEKRRNYIVSEPNYHTTKFFTEHLLATEIKKHKYLQRNLPIEDVQYYN